MYLWDLYHDQKVGVIYPGRSKGDALKGALEKGNQQLPCSTLLAAKRRSRRYRRLMCSISSLIILDRAGEIALAHNRLGRWSWIRDSWDLQISKEVFHFSKDLLSDFHWHAKCFQWPIQICRRRNSVLNIYFFSGLNFLLWAASSNLYPITNSSTSLSLTFYAKFHSFIHLFIHWHIKYLLVMVCVQVPCQ